MKLEIGPGPRRINRTWKTLGFSKRPAVDIVHDIRVLPLPLKDDSCSHIYMSHVLEHVPWFQTDDLLTELFRCVVPGGCLEIWVPDLRKLVEAYLDPTKNTENWWRFNPEKDPVKWFNGRMFTYGPGEDNWHRAVFDEQYLGRCLAKAGFTDVCRLRQNQMTGPNGHGPYINLGMKAGKK